MSISGAPYLFSISVLHTGCPSVVAPFWLSIFVSKWCMCVLLNVCGPTGCPSSSRGRQGGLRCPRSTWSTTPPPRRSSRRCAPRCPKVRVRVSFCWVSPPKSGWNRSRDMIREQYSEYVSKGYSLGLRSAKIALAPLRTCMVVRCMCEVPLRSLQERKSASLIEIDRRRRPSKLIYFRTFFMKII